MPCSSSPSILLLQHGALTYCAGGNCLNSALKFHPDKRLRLPIPLPCFPPPEHGSHPVSGYTFTKWGPSWGGRGALQGHAGHTSALVLLCIFTHSFLPGKSAQRLFSFTGEVPYEARHRHYPLWNIVDLKWTISFFSNFKFKKISEWIHCSVSISPTYSRPLPPKRHAVSFSEWLTVTIHCIIHKSLFVLSIVLSQITRLKILTFLASVSMDDQRMCRCAATNVSWKGHTFFQSLV